MVARHQYRVHSVSFPRASRQIKKQPIDRELGVFLSDLAYAKPEERQNKLNQSRYKDSLRLTGHNHAQDATLLYQNQGVHIYRGSATSEDLWTDAQLAQGKLASTDRYKQTAARIDAAQKQYGITQATHVGHSLGGTLATEMADVRKQKSVSFNAGVGLYNQTHAYAAEHHTRYRTPNDVVSYLDKSPGVVVVQPRNKKRKRFDGGLADQIGSAYSSHKLDAFYG